MSQNVKMKKIEHRLGSLDWIKIPSDWHKCEGIVAKRWETNAALAERDYSKKCRHSSEPLMVVEGFWIWWCNTHNHPLVWCELAKKENQLRKLQRTIKKLHQQLTEEEC